MKTEVNTSYIIMFISVLVILGQKITMLNN